MLVMSDLYKKILLDICFRDAPRRPFLTSYVANATGIDTKSRHTSSVLSVV
jgi:hypothetical protein